nr:MAG TPA: nuclear pore complex protein [Caudoviricetes sp.]
MANLGNLYFDILLQDKTDKQLKEIRSKVIAGLKTELPALDIKIDRSKLAADVRKALSGEKFTIDVRTSDGKALGSLTAGQLRAQRAAAIQAESDAKVALANARAKAAADRASASLQRLAAAHAGAAGAAERNASALGRTASAAQRTVGFMGSLRNELAQLGQVYFFQDLARRIVNVGGELENQRIAMGAILKDTGKAQSIFDKVQTLAVKSPFGVMQLNQSAKMLTAYNIQYSELYDTLRRIADISAGVGVSMDRIILAYGQIKAKHVLAGTELRQLTEANLPIIDMLSKQYSQQEGRLVSAAEIYDRVSRKQVSFEDVKKAFEEMTDAGGQFYNTQEAMSESLRSKWKNLGDAIDVAFGSVAQSGIGDVMKGMAETLTDMTGHWRIMTDVIIGAVAALKGYRVFALLTARAVDANLMGALAKSRALSPAAGASGAKATAENVAGAGVYLGQLREQRLLTASKAKYLIMTKQVNEAETRALQTMYKIDGVTLSHWQNANKVQKAWAGVSVMVSRAGALLRGIAVQGGIMLAFSAIAAIIGRIQERAAALRENLESIGEASSEASKNLREVSDAMSGVDTKTASSSELTDGIQRMVQTLKDYFPESADGILERIFGKDADGKVKSLAKKFTELRDAINDAQDAARLQKTMGEALANIDDDNGHWYPGNWNVKDYMDDYADELKKLDKQVREHAAENDKLSAALDKVKEKYPEFLRMMRENGVGANNIAGQISLLYTEGSRDMTQTFGEEVPFKIANMGVLVFGSRNLLRKAAAKLADEFTQSLAQQGYKKGTKAWNMAAQRSLEDFLDQNNVLDERVRRAVKDEFIKKNVYVHVKGKFSGAKDVVSDLDKYISEAFGGKYDKDLKGNTLAEKRKGAKGAYDASVEEVKAAQGVLRRLGVPTDGKTLKKVGEKASNEVKDAVRAYNMAVETMNAGRKGLAALGWGEEKKNDRPRTPKTDTALQNARSELNELREAYGEWQKLSESMGGAAALGEMRKSPFAKWFRDGGLDEDGYVRLLERLKNSMKGASKDRRTFRFEIDKIEFGLREETLKKAADEAYSQIQAWLEDFSSRWDLYKSLKKTTGDGGIARMAFGNYEMWDEEGRKLLEHLEGEMRKKGITAPLRLDMGGKEAENFFGKDKGLLELYKALQKQLRATGREWLTEAAESQKSLMTTEDKIRRLKERIQEVLDANNRGEISDEVMTPIVSGLEKQITELEREAFRASDVYRRLFESWEHLGVKGIKRIRAELDALISSAKDDGKGGFTLTGLDGKQYKASAGDLKQINEQVKKTDEYFNKKNPFGQISKSLEKLFSKKATKDEQTKALKNLGDSVLVVNGYVGELTSSFGRLFSAQGNESMAEAMQMTETVVSGISGVIQGFQSGDVLGGAVSALSAVANIITTATEQRNARLERRIEASRRRVERIEAYLSAFDNSTRYTLGNSYSRSVGRLELNKERADLISIRNLNKEIARAKAYTKRNDTERIESLEKEKALLESISADSHTYTSQMQVNLAQKYAELRELYYQRDKEWAKSNTSKSKINEYNSSIKDKLQEIRDYEEEVAETLYDINLKSWADDFSDALVSAWMNGTDAADAYSQKVGDIMNAMIKKWLSLEFIQPRMKEIQSLLFGDDGQGGFMRDGSLTQDEISQVADRLMSLQDGIGAWGDTINALIEGLKESGVQFGDSASGLSKGIQGVTENTADLLASYINGMRADLSLVRESLRELAEENLAGFGAVARQQLSELRNISANTLRNADATVELLSILRANTIAGRGFRVA